MDVMEVIKVTETIQMKLSDVELGHIEDILKNYEENKGNVVTLLQNIQETFGYIPRHVVSYISNKLKIPEAKIYGVATFYAQFTFNPKGKYVITCCDGTACHVKGAPLMIELLESKLGIKDGETTEDLLFTIESVACLGCCAIAPVCIINEDIYGNLSINKLNKLLRKLRKAEGLKN